MKPRLRMVGGAWFCFTPRTSGLGLTPLQAYHAWSMQLWGQWL